MEDRPGGRGRFVREVEEPAVPPRAQERGSEADRPAPSGVERASRMDWATLMKRTMGLPEEAPRPAPARSPPGEAFVFDQAGS